MPAAPVCLSVAVLVPVPVTVKQQQQCIFDRGSSVAGGMLEYGGMKKKNRRKSFDRKEQRGEGGQQRRYEMEEG